MVVLQLKGSAFWLFWGFSQPVFSAVTGPYLNSITISLLKLWFQVVLIEKKNSRTCLGGGVLMNPKYNDSYTYSVVNGGGWNSATMDTGQFHF